MGPNGSGKSTLAQILSGNGAYNVSKGSIVFGAKNLLKLKPEERAQAGIFLQFQNPPDLPGISLGTLVRRSRSALSANPKKNDLLKIGAEIAAKAKLFKFGDKFLEREMNGFSGGEKRDRKFSSHRFCLGSWRFWTNRIRGWTRTACGWRRRKLKTI